MKNSIFAASAAFAAIVSTTSAATLFNNNDVANSLLSNAGNWDNGLPTGQQGTVNLNAGWDSASSYDGYDLFHTGGTITPGGFETGGWNLGAGTTLLMDGGSIASTRGITVGSGSAFTLDSGTANLTANNTDSTLVGSATINGGTFQVGRNLVVNGGTFTVDGGIVEIATSIANFAFSSAGVGINFNGGTTSFGSFNITQATPITFGGSTAGTVTLDSLGTAGGPLNWLGGSGMELTITGADSTFYEGLYTGGDLLFESSNADPFASNFQVTGETLSLIPEPSSSALLALGMVALVSLRKRRNA